MDWNVYAVDVGSNRQAFAWQTTKQDNQSEGPPMRSLIRSIESDLHDGSRVALGLEAPLFLPLQEVGSDQGDGQDADLWRRFPTDLTLRKHKNGLEWASWFSQGGASSLASSLVFLRMLFRELKSKMGDEPLPIITHPDDASTTEGRLLLIWEAFVSGAAKGDHSGSAGHREDARQAALAANKFMNPGGAATNAPDCIAMSRKDTRVTREPANDLKSVAKRGRVHEASGWLNLVGVAAREAGFTDIEDEDFLIIKVLASKERELLTAAGWPPAE